MDEMRITTNFMRNMISKIVKAILRKKTGYDIDIQLNDVNAKFSDGKAHVHLNLDAELSSAELMKILKNVGLN